MQNQKNAEEEEFVPRPIIHPDTLGLKRIACNPEVLQRCGSMTFEIYDADNKENMVSTVQVIKYHLICEFLY